MTDEAYAPHIDDPDDPSEYLMSPTAIANLGKLAAILYPELIDKSGDGPVKPQKFSGATLAEWASIISQNDIKRIDMAIRSGVVSGLDNTEIARKVVGSLQLRGIDGVTEVTRQEVARLGHVVLTPKA